MTTCQLIEKHGLSVRQIPFEVFESYEMSHYREGDEIIEQHFPSGRTRRLCRRKRTPSNAGFWMCKRLRDTGSLVRWNIKTDNLAPTLSESVSLAIAQIEADQKTLNETQTIIKSI